MEAEASVQLTGRKGVNGLQLIPLADYLLTFCIMFFMWQKQGA